MTRYALPAQRLSCDCQFSLFGFSAPSSAHPPEYPPFPSTHSALPSSTHSLSPRFPRLRILLYTPPPPLRQAQLSSLFNIPTSAAVASIFPHSPPLPYRPQRTPFSGLCLSPFPLSQHSLRHPSIFQPPQPQLSHAHPFLICLPYLLQYSRYPLPSLVSHSLYHPA